jgi:FkbM family methyltransferase
MKTVSPQSLGDFFEILPELAGEHARTHPSYQELDKVAQSLVAASDFRSDALTPVPFGGLGPLVFPYTKMGAIDSLDLFGLDELIIFAFYHANRNRYRRAADIGANLGLHSILMAKCGWTVRAYEPDPHHASLLKRNVAANGVDDRVQLIEAAVSDKPGTLEFVRVVGNTTSSHLAGAKSNAYGELERFPVRVEPIEAIMPDVDFVKMDAEGQERIILLGTTAAHWARTDMMVEVGSPENATAIYEHLQKLGVNAFAQKLGWGRVATLGDMPTSYREGSLFITRHAKMPWA